jgi:hypothetical protein
MPFSGRQKMNHKQRIWMMKKLISVLSVLTVCFLSAAAASQAAIVTESVFGTISSNSTNLDPSWYNKTIHIFDFTYDTDSVTAHTYYEDPRIPTATIEAANLLPSYDRISDGSFSWSTDMITLGSLYGGRDVSTFYYTQAWRFASDQKWMFSYRMDDVLFVIYPEHVSDTARTSSIAFHNANFTNTYIQFSSTQGMAAVPVPGSLLLLGSGLFTFLLMGRKRKQRK